MFSCGRSCIEKRIYQQGLVNYLQDNQQAWLLQSDGTWVRAEPAEGENCIMLKEHY